MPRLKGFYKKNGKTRPITSRKCSVGTLQTGTAHLGVPHKFSRIRGKITQKKLNEMAFECYKKGLTPNQVRDELSKIPYNHFPTGRAGEMIMEASQVKQQVNELSKPLSKEALEGKRLIEKKKKLSPYQIKLREESIRIAQKDKFELLKKYHRIQDSLDIESELEIARMIEELNDRIDKLNIEIEANT